MLNKIPILLVN